MVDLEKVKVAMNSLNYKDLWEAIHSIKGSCAYAGGGRVTEICYHMQLAFHENWFEDMIPFYPKLIEAALEFRVYSKKKLCEYFK